MLMSHCGSLVAYAYAYAYVTSEDQALHTKAWVTCDETELAGGDRRVISLNFAAVTRLTAHSRARNCK